MCSSATGSEAVRKCLDTAGGVCTCVDRNQSVNEEDLPAVSTEQN